MRFESIFEPIPKLPNIGVESVSVNGMYGEWVTAPNVRADRIMLYLHGGGHFAGSCKAYRDFVARLSLATDTRGFVFEYRLAPEHPFPAAIEDSLAVYRWLLSSGFRSSQIFIAGDSAGGSMVLSTLLALRDASEPLPACAVLISPETDLTLTGESLTKLANVDPWITPQIMSAVARWYLGATDAHHPLASPLHADLHGLPPLLIHVGSDEVLLNDSTRFAEKAWNTGVDVTLRVASGMWHDWHIFAPILSEGQLAVDEIGAFIKQRMA
jgi:acetyl esterase/lipase